MEVVLTQRKTTLLNMSFCRLVSIYIYIFTLSSVSFTAEKIKHHISFPLILGATGVLVTITLLAVGIYARRRCLKDSNTIKRGIRDSKSRNLCLSSC